MKKLIFIILFSVVANAQTHRFIYEFQYKNDSTAAEYQKENMTLDINPDEVKFYEYDYAENDSLNKLRDFHNVIWNDTPVLKHNKNSYKYLNYILQDAYFYYVSEDKIDWKLSNETKLSGNYKLQKAETNFGGRHWIAWFCPEINLNEGPYKFRGLPGLIFEIQDSKKNFIFSLAKSMKLAKTYETKNFVESFNGDKAILVNLKTIQKKMLETFNDPLRDMRDSFDPNADGEYKVYGIKVTSKEQFKELTEMVQSQMRKENNPIELDKAVHYPEK